MKNEIFDIVKQKILQENQSFNGRFTDVQAHIIDYVYNQQGIDLLEFKVKSVDKNAIEIKDINNDSMIFAKIEKEEGIQSFDNQNYYEQAKFESTKKQIESIIDNDYSLYVKSVISIETEITDLKILDKLYDNFMKNDVTLVNEEITKLPAEISKKKSLDDVLAEIKSKRAEKAEKQSNEQSKIQAQELE